MTPWRIAVLSTDCNYECQLKLLISRGKCINEPISKIYVLFLYFTIWHQNGRQITHKSINMVIFNSVISTLLLMPLITTCTVRQNDPPQIKLKTHETQHDKKTNCVIVTQQTSSSRVQYLQSVYVVSNTRTTQH
jgi:hypothetical protein